MKRNSIKNNESPVISVLGLFIIGLLPFVTVRISGALGFANQAVPVHFGMRIVLAALLVFALILHIKGKLSERNMLLLLIVAGVIMRVGYLTYTNWMDRMHDLGSVSEGPYAIGNAGYILYNTLKGHLPDTNEYQFYQQPLYFILSAWAIRLMAGGDAASASPDLLKWAMAVSCAAACLTIPVIQRIMDALGIQRKHQIPAMAIAAFLPNWIFMGGRVNNDALVTLFMALVVYFTVKWYYDTSMKNMILLAFAFGFGIMAKVSCGTLAVFTAPVMLYKLYRSWKEKKPLPMIGQLAAFLGIAFPLALWYPIRNYLLFGQSLTFVNDIGKDSFVYTGNVPAFQRLLAVPVFSAWSQPYASVGDDYSVWMHFLRTTVFGEWEWLAPKLVSVSFFYINLLLVILALFAMVHITFKTPHKDYFARFMPAALCLIVIISFVSFNLSYPYCCTADARYVPMALAVGMIALAQRNEDADMQEKEGKRHRAFPVAVAVLAILFCMASVIMYA